MSLIETTGFFFGVPDNPPQIDGYWTHCHKEEFVTVIDKKTRRRFYIEDKGDHWKLLEVPGSGQIAEERIEMK